MHAVEDEKRFKIVWNSFVSFQQTLYQEYLQQSVAEHDLW